MTEERLGLKKKLISFSVKDKKKRLLLKVLVTFLFLSMLLYFLTETIRPTLLAICELNAKSIGVSVSNRIVEDVMKDVGYLDLIVLERNEDGKILALKANVIEMNRISSEITLGIQKQYNELGDFYIKIPIGNFTGNDLLAGMGPKLNVKIMPAAAVQTDFKTEFVSVGINQTRHRVYLEIINNVQIVAPFTSKTIVVTNNVNVAETVLIGEVPQSFLNLDSGAAGVLLKQQGNGM